MTDNISFYINKDAASLKHLFSDKNLTVKSIHDNIYVVNINGKSIDWIIKIYEELRYAKAESKNLKKLKNVNGVPKLLITGFTEDIILSKVPGLDLFDYMQKYGIMKEEQVKRITKKILIILKEIHSMDIIHKDIKPENIMYDKDSDELNIIDFEGKHTEDYWSPEQIKGNVLTVKTDIWSLGSTIYALLTGDCPFGGVSQVLKLKYSFEKEIYSELSEDFKDFITCLLDLNVKSRYTAEECLNHNWLSND
jgi:serine/threonine protein kinase